MSSRVEQLIDVQVRRLRSLPGGDEVARPRRSMDLVRDPGIEVLVVLGDAGSGSGIDLTWPDPQEPTPPGL